MEDNPPVAPAPPAASPTDLKSAISRLAEIAAMVRKPDLSATEFRCQIACLAECVALVGQAVQPK